MIIKDWEKLQRFENFNTDFNNTSEQSEIIQSFYKGKKRILGLRGAPGTGKTHLSKAVLNRALKNNCDYIEKNYMSYEIRDRMAWFKRVNIFIDSVDLYHSIMNNFYPKFKTEQEIYKFKQLQATRLIVIDDLGNEKRDVGDNFSQGFIKLLDNQKGKIVITTNLGPEEIRTRYGDKILSRLNQNSQWLILDGSDFRQTIKGEVTLNKECPIFNHNLQNSKRIFWDGSERHHLEPQEITVTCTGTDHIWKDSNGFPWAVRCPARLTGG